MNKKFYIAAAVFLAIIASSALIVYSYLNSFSRKNVQGNTNYMEPKDVKSGQPLNVLLLGLDVGTVGSQNSPQRSDTMMLLHYEPETAAVSMVSIPRDTRVSINGNYQKINAANAIGGQPLAVKTVEELLGIDVNYYVSVDYSGFRRIIDRIGGVDVVVPYDMDYDAESQDLHIHFKKGEKVHLNGQRAEEFVRWRKNNDGTGFADGDMGRIRAQQDFILKVFEKLKTPAGIMSLPSVAAVLPECIETNMEPMDIISLSQEITKINMSSIERHTLGGEAKTVGGLSYFLYSPQKSGNIVSLLDGKDIKEGGDLEGLDRGSIRVQVMNASGSSEAASNLERELKDSGYSLENTAAIGGAEFSSSYIIDKTSKRSAADRLSSELDIEDIVKDQDSLSDVDLVVILGLDKANMVE